MAALVALLALAILMLILWDGFQTVVLPHRVSQPFGLARLFYRTTWRIYSALVRPMRHNGRRETFLSFYGPLSLIMLLGFWAVDLIIAFAMLQWALGGEIKAPEGPANFFALLYMSGVTFFTLGFGDVIALSALGRLISVVEAGMGFGFLAVVIGYLPVLYTSFSQREINVSLLDARAGSPPTGAEFLRRHAGPEGKAAAAFLHDWERWSAELLESHLSFSVLGYYRSQHDNQSWVASLTMILDACVLVLTGTESEGRRQAQLTFAMARHAAVDLSQIYNTPPHAPSPDRLTADQRKALRAFLLEAGAPLSEGEEADVRLDELRAMYEPYVNALATYLLMPLPPWLPKEGGHDDWELTSWERPSRGHRH